MDRRDFIRSGLLAGVAGASLLVPTKLFSSSVKLPKALGSDPYKFALRCMEGAIPYNDPVIRIDPDRFIYMQIFKNWFEMPFRLLHSTQYKDKFRETRKQHITELGKVALYGIKSDVSAFAEGTGVHSGKKWKDAVKSSNAHRRNNIRYMSGAKELLERMPTDKDECYFIFLAGNGIDRFMYTHTFRGHKDSRGELVNEFSWDREGTFNSWKQGKEEYIFTIILTECALGIKGTADIWEK